MKSLDQIPLLTALGNLGGITVYSPLKHNGCGPGKRVGIVGIGGLGHFGLLFAKALGADKIVAISRNSSKKEDALKMGADDLIATEDDPEWATKNQKAFDLIISTSYSNKLPLSEYLGLLDIDGTFIQVGAPEDLIPAFSAFSLVLKRVKIGGSLIGSRKEIREMLDLADKMKVKPWTKKRPMNEANKVLVDFEKGMPRYRYVLCN